MAHARAVTLRYNPCMISPNTGDIPRVGVQVPLMREAPRVAARVFCEVDRRSFCRPDRVVREPALALELQVGGQRQDELRDQLDPRIHVEAPAATRLGLRRSVVNVVHRTSLCAWPGVPCFGRMRRRVVSGGGYVVPAALGGIGKSAAACLPMSGLSELVA
jgi:hypothetical protein